MINNKIYKGFFSGTFGKGTFDFDWKNNEETKEALSQDYRVKSVLNNNIEKLYTDNGYLYLPDINVVYTGPFWAEKTKDGKDTIYNCKTLCYNEIERIKDSDFFVCVLTNNPSVGSVSELMTALYYNKPIAVFYELDKKMEPLSIPTRHWWSVAALKRIIDNAYNGTEKYNERIILHAFDNFEELYKLLKKPAFYQILMKDEDWNNNREIFRNIIDNIFRYESLEFFDII